MGRIMRPLQHQKGQKGQRSRMPEDTLKGKGKMNMSLFDYWEQFRMDIVSFWTPVQRWRLLGIVRISDSHPMFANWQADRDRRDAEAVHSTTATSSTSPMPPADIYDSDTSGEPQGTEGGESEMETVEEEVEDEDGGNPGNHITQRGEHSASEGATLQSSSSAPADGGPGGRLNYQ